MEAFMPHAIEVFSPLLSTFGTDGIFAEVRRAGLQNLDLSLGPTLWGIARKNENPLEIPDDELVARAHHLNEKAHSYGVIISTVSCFADFEKPEGRASIERSLKIGQVLGASVLVTGSGLDLDTAIPVLKELGAFAGELGLTIAIETHPPMGHNSTASLDTLSRVDSPNIRLNFDTANIYYYNEGVDGEEELKKVIDYVVHLHLKDSRKGYKENFFPALGDGVIDFKRIFSILDEAGFTGCASIEIEGPAALGKSPTHDIIRDALKRSVDHLRCLAII